MILEQSLTPDNMKKRLGSCVFPSVSPHFHIRNVSCKSSPCLALCFFNLSPLGDSRPHLCTVDPSADHSFPSLAYIAPSLCALHFFTETDYLYRLHVTVRPSMSRRTARTYIQRALFSRLLSSNVVAVDYYAQCNSLGHQKRQRHQH